MSEQLIMITLRLLHIGAGVFWVGSVLFMNIFVLPPIQAAGPEGGKLAAVLMRGGRIQRAMIHAALVTMISGFLIYGRFIMVTDGAWASSVPAMGYGLGAIASVIAFLLGILIGAPAARRLQAIGANDGGPLTADQEGEVRRLRARMSTASRFALPLLVVAVISMAVSRYL
ncbi:MAG TPA: hypothetical protein VMM77_01900 [Gemmatimonadaceae bacterium]|nr:hypothetical protein [Gemmatimonadaceae bacterium]